MKANVGTGDRWIRVILGLVVGFLGYSFGGSLAYVGYVVGAVLLLTGVIGWCWLYTLLGINTCPAEKRS